ncbi:hypothetical protein, partial [Kingella kingae]|uniref:hypothetical protein n=1 Tax=Kingella kingae TaxID=504 RepID=UPI0018AD5830
NGLAVMAMLGAAPHRISPGFEAEAKGMADKIYKGIYGIVGVVALIIVLWQCVEGWSGRKSWIASLLTCSWVIAAAGSGALVTCAGEKKGSP